MSFFRHVTFDLDDTLLDTSGGLIPVAARRAMEVIVRDKTTDLAARESMIEALMLKRSEILRQEPRADIWKRLAGGNSALGEEARQVFLRPPLDNVPATAVRLTDGAIELLKWTKANSTIHLVTSGDPTIQTGKINRLGIGDFFETIQIVEARPSPPNGKGPKYEAFLKTREKYSDIPARSFLSIGNRVDTDLGEAKLLDWRTVWIRHGEHAHLAPAKPSEIPDFEVATPKDLLSIWRQQFQERTSP
ncbi:MAG: HAD family hydrolase [Bdellovibrionales bacterium]|nr:HAD family hydrolase [Bdellovibrionales bacterium]